jgi:hypothetical protein
LNKLEQTFPTDCALFAEEQQTPQEITWVRSLHRMTRAYEMYWEAEAEAAGLLLPVKGATGLTLKSTDPATQQLKQHLPVLYQLFKLLQYFQFFYHEMQRVIDADATVLSGHTAHSVLHNTFVRPLALAIDAALLKLKPALGLKGPVPLDHLLSLLGTRWTTNKARE